MNKIQSILGLFLFLIILFLVNMIIQQFVFSDKKINDLLVIDSNKNASGNFLSQTALQFQSDDQPLFFEFKT